MMRLWWSSRSPYVRKVTVALAELGLAGRVELVPVAVSQRSPQANPELASINPMVSIPTLQFDDGGVLADSTLICLALEDRFGSGSLVPRSGSARQEVLARTAAGSLMIDAAMQLRLYLGMKADTLADRIGGYRWKLGNALDAAEGGHATAAKDFDLGSISLAVALAYFDFRLPEIQWRANRPRLSAWHDAIATRPSFAATEFRDG
jgi:glutathione S-transferase